MYKMYARRATHACSWYFESGEDLDRQLGSWLAKVELTHGPARAIIAPHAGYEYSGFSAAFAYKQINPAAVKRIFILGPSHHVRLSGCALSEAAKYITPIYDLKLDQQVISELQATKEFDTMNRSVDEAEHSIEMHLPYIAKIMSDFKDNFTIVPILVGSLTSGLEQKYGKILAPYLTDPQNLFVISSDFCHWGGRFRYHFYNRQWGFIHQSIQKLDEIGMSLIEELDPEGFTEYLKKYGNTICGRHPIGVLLQAVAHIKKSTSENKMKLKFLHYAQSNQCYSMLDSSVSYAAASLVFE